MKISVVMTSYNSEKYISEQLESILQNCEADTEIIICDDCSTDNTINIINTFDDSRIKLYINNVNLGVNKNFENALHFVTGDIVIISDSDNVWLKGKITHVLPYFRNNKVGLVMHDAIITNDKLEPIVDSYFGWRHSKPGLLRNIIKNGYGGSMIAFKSSLMRHILPFPKKMPFFFDEWIGMVCSKYSKCIFINEKLSMWRRHDSTVSSINQVPHSNQDKTDIKHFFIFIHIINIIIDRINKIILIFFR